MKVVVITGASSGIGAALAKQLGARGDSLVLAARRERELTQVAGEASPTAIPVVTDVRRRQDVERLRDAALQAFGRVDVWVNNAGRGIVRKVLDLTDEDWDEMMNVNARSALYGMQAILPHFMQRGQGHLINVSSFLGRVPLATYRSAYNAAKSALNALTANLRMDLKADYPRIHVSLVMPGTVATDFSKNALWETPGALARSRFTQSQSPEQAAAAIVSLIEQPKPELYTNPALAERVHLYYQDVGAFEDSLAS